MNKIISSIAASALMLVTAAPAKALTVGDFMERLQTIGITVVYNDCDGAYGKYSPVRNEMCINEDLLDPSKRALFDETLAHEAVHVVQDCMDEGGVASDYLIPIITAFNIDGEDTTKLKQYVSENLSETYYDLINGIDNPVIQKAEMEAYSMESDPELVYDILRAACLPN